MTEILTTQTTDIPVSVYEARAHLRVDLPDDDIEIYNLIRRATSYAENYTGRVLCAQGFTKYSDYFLSYFSVDRRPVLSIDSIKYIDVSGNQQTVSTSVYRVDLPGGRITLEYAQSWPQARAVINTVEIAYTAGYLTAASPRVGTVPEEIKHAILLIVGAWFENKEDINRGRGVSELPAMTGARALLDSQRVYAI